ncbi:ABC transporter permease [Streptomyces noursei]|nr:ABC transporter permease [Streptomyces noursei]
MAGPRSDSGNSPIFGHPWSAAALAPFTLRAGHAPTGPRQVVLDGDLAARAGVRTGERITPRHWAPHPYEVVGIAAPAARGDATGLGHQGAVFFDDETARRLAGHPATTDAIGILADPGVDVRQLYPRLRQALDGAHPARDASAGTRYKEDATALRVLTGNGRGEPEFLESAPSRMSLLMLLATVCVTVLMIAVLVVSSTVAQAVHQRSREMALLRAVGATPRQLRATVAREINVVAVAAALLGAIGAVPVFLQLIAMLQERGAVPMGLELPTPVWMFAVPVLTAGLTLLVARLSAALACGRIASSAPRRRWARRSASRHSRAAGGPSPGWWCSSSA